MTHHAMYMLFIDALTLLHALGPAVGLFFFGSLWYAIYRYPTRYHMMELCYLAMLSSHVCM